MVKRCQRRIVSGFTTWDKSSRLGQIRVIHTNNARSLPCSRRRDGARRKAILSFSNRRSGSSAFRLSATVLIVLMMGIVRRLSADSDLNW